MVSMRKITVAAIVTLATTATAYGSRAAQVVVTDGPLVFDVELAEGEVDAVN